MKPYTIGVLGSHSAEEVGMSARDNGFLSLVVCQNGREKLYTKYNSFLFTEKMVLPSFNDMIQPENITKLQEHNTIWFPNRSFSVYVDLKVTQDKEKFPIPMYGSRKLLNIEDRRSQYDFLDKAKIRRPFEFKTPDDIDRLALVKVQQKNNPLERAFFFVTSAEDYENKCKELIGLDVIAKHDLQNSVIEEFVLGPRFNANFHAYGLEDEFGSFDLVGFDDRVQANLSGILNLPAHDQLKLNIPITNEEIGHKGLTMRESKKPLVYEAAEKFVKACKDYFSPGIIGLFALQGAVTDQNEFVIFDISPRIPGSPCLGPTSPEMRRLSIKYGRKIKSPLDLSMMEIKKAILDERISEVTT